MAACFFKMNNGEGGREIGWDGGREGERERFQNELASNTKSYIA